MRGQEPKGRKVQILATMVPAEDGASARGSSFANVLELGERRLLLESCRSLEEGARLQVSFFVPGNGHQGFEKLSITCVVAKARNRRTLHYEAEIVDLDEASQQVLAGCLETNKPNEESIP